MQKLEQTFPGLADQSFVFLFSVAGIDRRGPRWNWREKLRRSMRLLLDESLPWRLASLMVGHDVTSVQRFAGISISMRI